MFHPKSFWKKFLTFLQYKRGAGSLWSVSLPYFVFLDCSWGLCPAFCSSSYWQSCTPRQKHSKLIQCLQQGVGEEGVGDMQIMLGAGEVRQREREVLPAGLFAQESRCYCCCCCSRCCLPVQRAWAAAVESGTAAMWHEVPKSHLWGSVCSCS